MKNWLRKANRWQRVWFVLACLWLLFILWFGLMIMIKDPYNDLEISELGWLIVSFTIPTIFVYGLLKISVITIKWIKWIYIGFKEN